MNDWLKPIRSVFDTETEGCLTPAAIRRFVLNALTQDQAREVTRHLAACGHCLSAYRAGRTFELHELRSDEADAGLAHALREWLRRALTTPRLEFAAGTRGLETHGALRAEVLDGHGEPTGETVPLALSAPPRWEPPRLTLALQVDDAYYEGAEAHCSLVWGRGELRLGRSRVRQARIEAAFELPVRMQAGRLPADRLRVQLHPPR